MSNAKYDQIAAMQAYNEFDWATDYIQAYLMRGVTFVGNQERYSQAVAPDTAFRVGVATVNGRYYDESGNAAGLPVTFPRAVEDTDHQMLLVKDDGWDDPLLVAFFDTDAADQPLRLLNSGTLIVRPQILEGAEPPNTGIWLQFSEA